jgi:PAT family beta-lactamase induction signal transducer AmpG
MSAPAESAAHARNTFSSLAFFVERRALVMLALGFAAGLPYFLVFDTLSAWLRASGISLEVIGFFSLVTLISSFKFLWAPLVDRAAVPLVTAWLGHRRSWMLVCQVAIVAGLWLIAGLEPTVNLTTIAAFAMLIGFSSATQDIAIDAWRIEAAETERQGAMAAAYQWGYRIALLTAGAVPLMLAGPYGWGVSYAVMAALMTIGIAAVLAAPRERAHEIRQIHVEGIRPAPIRETAEWAVRLLIVLVGALLLGSGLAANASALAGALRAVGADGAAAGATSVWTGDAGALVQVLAVIAGFAVVIVAALPFPGVPTRPGAYLSAALVDPLRDFFSRYGSSAGLILALICLYRIPDFVLNIMNPFYLDLGFTLLQIAEVRKIFGAGMLMFGVFAGGLAVARLGLLRALVIGAFLGPASNLLFVWLTLQPSLFTLFVAIGLDNVAGGFAGTCLIAYMSSLTSTGFTATQYALLSSLYAIPGRLIASQSGRIVESAAAAAEEGGALSAFTRLFTDLPPGAFAAAVERSAVSPAALGSGYLVFFTYSTCIGLVAVVLAFVVAKRQASP